MSFGQAVRSGFRQYATFSGRATRSEFWWFYLAMSISSFVLVGIPYIFFVIALVAWSSGSDSGSSSLPAPAWIAIILLGLGALASLALSLPLYAVMARRLHDTGQSAHWIWLSFAGAGIVPLVMCIMDGNAYDNQHGPDPKASERYSGEFPSSGYAQPGYTAQPSYPAVPPPYTPQASPAAGNDPFSTPGN